jgi:hypothetical protein
MEGGHRDTVAGVFFTYRFDQPWRQQIRRTPVNGSATADGFRYELVDRENRMPLAYRKVEEEKKKEKKCSTPICISVSATDGGDFISGDLYSTALLTALVTDADGNPINGATVTWAVIRADNNSSAMYGAYKGENSKKSGLTWGQTPEAGLNKDTLLQERITGSTNPSQYNINNSTTPTGSDGKTEQRLTDIVGEREITVEAKVKIGETDYTATQAVSFGKGPLSVFTAPKRDYSQHENLINWDVAYKECNGADYTGNHSTGWSSGAYVGGSIPPAGTDDGKMPTQAEMQAVAVRYPYNSNNNAQGAAHAAGWPDNWWWWVGQSITKDMVVIVVLADGGAVGGYYTDDSNVAVACRR